MLSPFLMAECDWGLLSVDRAEAARDRLIPAAMIAPPTRTFLRDISLLSIVIGSKIPRPRWLASGYGLLRLKKL
jgi:hypothetical protein